jgi:hypothetical protein
MSPQSEEPRNQRSQQDRGENRSKLGRHLGTGGSLEAGVDGGLYKAEAVEGGGTGSPSPFEGVLRNEAVEGDETINGVGTSRIKAFGAQVVEMAGNKKDKFLEMAGDSKDKFRKLATVTAVGVVAVGGAKEVASNYNEKADAAEAVTTVVAKEQATNQAEITAGATLVVPTELAGNYFDEADATVAQAAGVAVATNRSVAGASASNKYMKPRAIKQFLFRRAATYNDKNDMRPTSLILTQDKLEMKGRCNPKNPYNPLFKFWKNAPEGTVNIACGETRKYVRPFKPPIYDAYIKVVDNLGGKLARHAGVADSQRGKPTSIVATNRFTKLKFDNSGGPVRSILFRGRGKPLIYK